MDNTWARRTGTLNGTARATGLPALKVPVRVAHIVVQPRLEGSQRSMLEICRRLDRRRYEPHVLCASEGQLTEELQKAEIDVHLVPSLQRALHPRHDLRALKQIRRVCTEQRFDIVHTHNSKGGVLGRLGAHLAGVSCIVHHVQGYAFHEFSGPLARWGYGGIEKLAARWCDTVIFVNDEERELSLGRGWLTAEQATTIFNGVDLTQFTAERRVEGRARFRERHGIAPDELVILFSGRFAPQKQPLILPEIAAGLETARPSSSWGLYLAGTGPMESEVRARVRRLGIEHRVKFLGWEPHPDETTSGSDVVLLPSLWEGLPLSLIEGQAAALPEVASDIKGNREVVGPDTGVLCDPMSVEAYIAALVRLLDDEGLRRRLGEAGRQKAEALYGIDRTARQVQQLYELLLSREATRRRNGSPSDGLRSRWRRW